jgi:hypothetical protein
VKVVGESRLRSIGGSGCRTTVQNVPPAGYFFMTQTAALDRAKLFTFEHFERLLVLMLVASLLLIHWFVDDKVAFLSFYYLPVILAGFQLGRRVGALAAVFIVTMVAFLQAVVGFSDVAGLATTMALALLPWAGFLVLTGYVVGYLSEQRNERLDELKRSYLTMLELLTFHLESSERQVRGHSYRVAARSIAIGQVLGMRAEEIEQLRVASLLHELRPSDPRLVRFFENFPGGTKELPVVRSMRAAIDIIREYARYHEHVGGDWPIDHLRIDLGTKVLAVADAFETLQLPAGNRPALTSWAALEEVERGQGTTFSTDVVRALRVSVPPDRVIQMSVLATA